ncbi:MAG: MOSC domain-containing protein [Gammaproteobacteria bacterium]|nr:MOSC domain-containing protein [Gammaproteobacteria bacterium]
MSNYVSLEILDSAMAVIQGSPAAQGTVEMIVCRPEIGERLVLEEAELDVVEGLLGDNWRSRGGPAKHNDERHLAMQINIMNSRAIDAIASGERDLWPLAGDQFFVDFDLSAANLPAGTRLEIGTAVVEVTEEPHLGCKKFMQRFGRDAVKFVNSDEGKAIKLRGINARVISPGVVTNGGVISKLAPF